MDLSRRLAAAFLTASVCASAQTVARPSALAPAVRAVAPPLALPALAPAPALTAAPLAGPAPAPISAPAAAPAAARLAPLAAAVADFARTEEAQPSAAAASASGEALMLRALGGAAAATEAAPVAVEEAARVPAPLAAAGPARADSARIYLMSAPLRERVELGPVARVMHYAVEIACQILKAALAWQTTGSTSAGLAVLGIEVFKSPAMITAQSLTDLQLRYWWRKLGVLREVARAPAVTRVRVLTTGEAEFSGPLARRKDNTGLVFIEAESAPEGLPARLGAAIPIADAAAQSVRLSLQRGEATLGADWTPSLADLLDARPIPPETARGWREALAAEGRPVAALFGANRDRDLRLEAALIGEDGSEKALGAIAYGGSARTLAGLGKLDRLRARLGRTRAERSIHLSDSRVERPGEERERGPLGAARRAWRRLTGALIVAK